MSAGAGSSMEPTRRRLPPIIGGVARTNVASKRVLAKNGFQSVSSGGPSADGEDEPGRRRVPAAAHRLILLLQSHTVTVIGHSELCQPLPKLFFARLM